MMATCMSGCLYLSTDGIASFDFGVQWTTTTTSSSKAVAEHLVQTAINNGASAVIYRPGQISANRETGYCDLTHYVHRLVLAFAVVCVLLLLLIPKRITY
jgi:thioester reductase-like protein